MTERTSAPHRRLGGLTRHLAVIAALASITAGTAATAAHADTRPAGAPAASTATAVPGDLDGDGTPDVAYTLSADQGLRVISSASAPYAASDYKHTPDGNPWSWYLLAHHGSLTGSQTDDLFAYSTKTGRLFADPNDANYGGAPGHFTHPEHAVEITKPACVAPADCTGYPANGWGITQLVATEGLRGGESLPGLITVENSRLWYYPGKAGSVLGNPVQLSGDIWGKVTVVAPGKVDGVPTLWLRDDATGAITSQPLAFNPDGTPSTPLRAPVPHVLLSGVTLADGTHPCVSAGASGSLVLGDNCGKGTGDGWVLGTDHTVRTYGGCLDSTQADGSPAAAISVTRETCDGNAHQQWTGGPGGTLVAGAGRCLTAALDAYKVYEFQLTPCDGTPAQTFGIMDSNVFGVLPPALPLLPVSIHQTVPNSTPGYLPTYQSTVTSAGDAGGSAVPDLVVLDRQLTEYPGQPAAGGTARFGAAVPLGYYADRSPVLASNGQLNANDVIYSACAKLTMQTDGNLTLTKLKTGQLLWSTNTSGAPYGKAYAAMQTDGNFVVYNALRAPLWSTNTWSPPNMYGVYPTSSLTLQDDCNLVLTAGQPVWSTQTYDPAYDNTGKPLASGATLRAGDSLAVKLGHLDMQADGNLVLYSALTGHALWNTSTWGHPGASVTMQADGNLVVHDASNQSLWNSGTAGHPGAHFILANTRELVVQDANGYRLWWTYSTVYWDMHTSYGSHLTSGTVFHAGDYLYSPSDWLNPPRSRLVMQADGNFVLYLVRTGQPIWSTGTNNHPGAYVTMQADGNLVVYGPDDTPLWRSNTWGNPGAEAIVQSDGNFVVYDLDRRPLWCTNTQWYS